MVIGCLAVVGCAVSSSQTIDRAVMDLALPVFELREKLSHDGWYVDPAWSLLEIPPAGVSWSEVAIPLRWRHSGVDAERAEGAQTADVADNSGPSSPTVEELEHLASDPPPVGPNAAILLAQRDPVRGRRFAKLFERLVTGERRGRGEEKFSPSESMRAAAAEAWCLVLVEGREDFEQALAPVGRALLEANLPESLRGELFRTLARWIAPDRIPGLAQAIASRGDPATPAAEPYRAALEACVIHALARRIAQADTDSSEVAARYDESLWPEDLQRSRWDREPVIRALFGRWAALAGHPQAVEILRTQLEDADDLVESAALVSLALADSDEARSLLEQEAQRRSGTQLRTAVRALAFQGAAAIERFSRDPSPVVRVEVARQMAHWPTVATKKTLARLAGDRHPDVQAAAVRSIATWPDDLAGPVLLSALVDGYWATRSAAWDMLQTRYLPREPFPLDADRPQRVSAVRRIAAATGWSWPVTGPTAVALPKQHETVARSLQEELIDRLEVLTQADPASPEFQTSVATLRQAGADALPVVKDWLAGRPASTVPEILYRELLPEWDPAFAALAQMQSEDVFERQRGAQRLAELAHAKTLHPSVLSRLWWLLTREQSRLVWGYAMQAVLPDATEDAVRIAALALNHSWPDVKVLGCRYVARHHNAELAEALLPLLHDRNRSVQLAAIEAAGACRHPVLISGRPKIDQQGALPGLPALLTHADFRIRFAAARSLARLGDPRGAEELRRLTHHPDPKVRTAVAEAMGTSGHAQFVGDLIQLGWTERDASVRLAVLDALRALVPPHERPPALAEAKTRPQQMDVWAAWWEKRRAARRADGDVDPQGAQGHTGYDRAASLSSWQSPNTSAPTAATIPTKRPPLR